MKHKDRIRIIIEGATYFMTTVTRDRQRVFADERTVLTLVDIIKTGCGMHKARLITYAVMPDHYHLLVDLADDGIISTLMHSINSFSSNKIGCKNGPLWKPCPWDVVIRNEDMLYQEFAYTLLNPWRKGLVQDPLDDTVRTNIRDLKDRYGLEYIQDLFEHYSLKGRSF